MTTPLTAAAAAATSATGFRLDKKPDTAPTAAAFNKSPVEIGDPAMFALIAAEAAATPAPTKVLITSDSGELPSGSTRMTGLFSQYANILAEEAVGVGGGECVRIDEPAVGEVIVPALEVVKARFAVVVVTTVAKRVDVPDEAGLRNLRAFFIVHRIVAPRAVVVGGDERTGGIQKGNDVALRVKDVVVERRGRAVVVDHGERLVAVVIDKLERLL